MIDETIHSKEDKGMRRFAEGTLRATLNENSGHNLYGNRVDATVVAESEFYRVITLDVNMGVSSSIFQEDTPEVTAANVALKESVVSIKDDTLFISSPDNRTVYLTIDLNRIVPKGWTVQAQRLTEKKPTSIGLIIVEPDHVENVADVHQLTNADYREAGAAQCENKSGSNSIFPTPVQCEREAQHIGEHQAYNEANGYHYNWLVNRVASASPQGEFGFKNVCPHCGYVTAGGSKGNQVCSLCWFWLDHQKAGGGFIIEGRHYRPGRGGFGGRVFHIQRHDGSNWTGELFTQGEIPSWMTHLFPDNAVFVEK